MTGFFNKEEVEIDLTQIPGDKKLLKPKAPKKVYGCNDCLRCSKGQIKVRDDENSTEDKEVFKMVPCSAPDPIEPEGLGQKGILIVLDELTEYAHVSGSPIVGNERKLLEKALGEVGLDLYRDCWVVNSVRGKSRKGGNVGFARKACSKVLMDDIERLQPKVVVTTGFSALSTLYSEHGPSINKDWEKWVAVDETAIPDQILGCFVTPLLDFKRIIEDLTNQKKKIERYAKESQEKNGYVSKRYQLALDPKLSLVDNEALWNDDLTIQYNWIKRGMRTIVKYLDIPFKKNTRREEVETLTDKKEILEAIAYMNTKRVLGTDIETNSLKPYRTGAKIFCIGFSDGKRHIGYSTNDPDIIDATKALLTNPEVKFVIHNYAFEWKWFKRVWGIEVENIFVDSMIMQHAWDHRTGCAGLKYSVFSNYGVDDSQYDGKCKPFFNDCEADKTGRYAKSEQTFNKFEEALENGILYNKGLLFPLHEDTSLPKEELKKIKEENKRRHKKLSIGYLTEEEQLLYVGMDAAFCLDLVKTLRPKLTDKEREAIRFYTDGVLCLAHMTDNGMKINPKQLQANIDELNKEINSMHLEVLSTEEAKKWTAYIEEQISTAVDSKEIKKLEEKKIINYNSNAQLSELLFKVLGYKSIKKTSSGANATDAGTLEKLNSQMCNLIIARKKKIKARDTYLMGWMREADEDWIVHPNYNLGALTSHRSSSNSPNSQNSPKRNKYMKKLTRNFIIPHSPTQRIISGDYTGAETRCMASIAQDPQMRIYMEDSEHNDMHRDGTKDVFKLHNTKFPSDLLEELRGIIKNNFTFPLFYGDYYGNCAIGIWEALRGISEENKTWLENHMIKEGIANIKEFTEHLKECERILWGVRFKKISEWKTNNWKKFIKQGYIETAIGFRLRGRLNRKQVGNYLIQGPSWAVLLQGMIYIDKEIRRLGLKSKLINEIHDDCISSSEIAEIEIMKKLYVENLLIKARNAPLFKDWMDVKFLTDMEIHDQDNFSWATKPTPIPVKEEDYTENYITA